MMRFCCLIFALTMTPFVSKGQIKIYEGVYLQFEKTHTPIYLKSIIFITNASGNAKDVIIERFEKHKIKAISYYDLFPAIKSYSESYIDSTIKSLVIDAYIVVNIDSKPYSGYSSFSGYIIGSAVFGSLRPANGAVLDGTVLFFNDANSPNPYARVDADLASKDGFGNRQLKLIDKAVHLAILGLERNNLILNKYKN